MDDGGFQRHGGFLGSPHPTALGGTELVLLAGPPALGTHGSSGIGHMGLARHPVAHHLLFPARVLGGDN